MSEVRMDSAISPVYLVCMLFGKQIYNLIENTYKLDIVKNNVCLEKSYSTNQQWSLFLGPIMENKV